MLRRAVRSVVRRSRTWIQEKPHEPERKSYVEDRRWPHVNSVQQDILKNEDVASYPYYAWGALMGVRLARTLGVSRVSIVEFGVAGGNGLVALDRIAEQAEQIYGVGINVYGFDSGHGLPKPNDYRDLPHQFREGDYPMDVGKLKRRLRKSELLLGPIQETILNFITSQPAPVCFVSIDVDLYSSTMSAFKLLDSPATLLMPRIYFHFDDIMGTTFGDCNGERLAISDFNASHELRKISPIYGLKSYLPSRYLHALWPEQVYLAHICDHELYGCKDYDIVVRESNLRVSSSDRSSVN